MLNPNLHDTGGKVTCPECSKSFTPDLVKRPDWAKRYTQYRSGGHIQDAWPNATAMQREQLTSGVCSDLCWNQYAGELDAGP